MKVKSTKQTLEKLLTELQANRPFCYTRFGDSQLMAMANWAGQDWEQIINAKLAELQRKAIEVDDEAYLIAPSCGYKLEKGMKKGVFDLYRNNADLEASCERYAQTKTFWHCEAIHYGMLFRQTLTKKLFKEINKHEKLLIIAGEDLNVKEWFPNARFLFIPMANAFGIYEEILNKIYSYQPEVVLLSCGLTSQVLQYFMFLDKSYITTINMGSVFNALLEITTAPHGRSWIKQNIDKIQKFKKLLKK